MKSKRSPIDKTDPNYEIWEEHEQFSKESKNPLLVKQWMDNLYLPRKRGRPKKQK